MKCKRGLTRFWKHVRQTTTTKLERRRVYSRVIANGGIRGRRSDDYGVSPLNTPSSVRLVAQCWQRLWAARNIR